MKRTVVIIAVLLFLLSLYYDIKVGTLPLQAQAEKDIPASSVETSNIPYFERLVSQGDTVLSIVERHAEALPVSIEQVIKDFIELNQVEPNQMQAGKIYKFPTYSE